MKVAGLLSESAKIKNVSATYEWYDKKEGVIKWIFYNPNSVNMSFTLVRGVIENGKLSEIYPFGNAFYPVYYKNFGTQFALNPQPLKNVNASTNSPPLCIYKNPDGTMFAAFLFTLEGGQKYEMLEGGWTGGIVPGGIKTVTSYFNSDHRFTINFVKEQCSGYNQESGTDYPCPEDPFTVKSALMELNENVKPLFNDNIERTNSCEEIINNPENTAEYYIKLLQCLLDDRL